MEKLSIGSETRETRLRIMKKGTVLFLGEHTVVVKATDSEGNVGAGKITFEL